MPLTPFETREKRVWRKLFTLLLWALTLFMLASGIVFLPSLASLPMLAFAGVSLPARPVQDLWRRVGLTAWKKALVLTALFALSAYLAPV